MEVDQSLDLSRESLFDRIVLFFAAGMFVAMIILATVQVVVRTFSLPVGVHWTEPAARFLLIVSTFLGAAVATRNREHIRMTFVLDKLAEHRPGIKRPFDVISSVVVVIFTLFALAGTVPATTNNWASNLGGVGFVTSGMLYLGITIGLSCMLLYELQSFYYNHLQRYLDDSPQDGGKSWN